MNKKELIEQVSVEMGCSKTEAEKQVNAVLAAIKKGLSTDQNVQLVGFGSFQVVTRKARKGRNPQTGEPLDIAESKAIRFKAGKQLREKESA